MDINDTLDTLDPDDTDGIPPRATRRPTRRMARGVVAAAAALGLLLALAGCGGDDDDAAADSGSGATTTTADSGSGSDAADATLTIESFSFSDVSVPAGGMLKIVNSDNARHTVTADDGSFDESIAAGETITIQVPDEPGEYTFHCEVHPSMTATLTVE